MFDRLSSPALIAWPTFWIVLVLSTLMTALTSFTLFAANPVRMALAILIGQLVMFAILAGGYAFLRRVGRRTRIVAIIPLIAIATAGRGVALAIALSVLGLQSPPQWALRIGGSILSNSIVVILVVLVVASVREHRALLAEYAARNAELQVTRDRAHQEITERHTQAVERIRGQLLDRLDDMAGQPPIEIRNAMQQTAEDVVRPLSHELAQQTPVLYQAPNILPSSRIDWRGVASDATLGRPLPALALALSMVVIGALWTFTVFASAAALFVLGAGLVVIWALATIINEIMYRISPTAGPVVRSIVMTLLLFATGIVTGSAATITMASDPHSRTVAVGDSLFIPILGWLLSGAKAAQNQQRRLEAAMMETNEALAWEIARAGETQWQQRRALSRALHGPVQGAIGGAAVRLDLALQTGEPTDTLIVELRGHVVDAIDLLGSQQPAPDLNTTIEQLQGVYRGACEITFHSPKPVLRALKDDHTCAATATELVSEAVWNAIRHGKARHVRIDVLPAKPAAIRITVTDDGTITDPEHEDQRGLGTAMLDEVALEWTRQRSNTGTKLVATLPIA